MERRSLKYFVAKKKRKIEYDLAFWNSILEYQRMRINKLDQIAKYQSVQSDRIIQGVQLSNKAYDLDSIIYLNEP